MFVTIYNVEQCYGGPEEGGWWYDWWTPCESFEVANREAADQLCTLVGDYCKLKTDSEAMQRARNTANMPEGDSPYRDTEGYIPKGWGDGGEYRVVCEEERGSRQSTETPYYC